MPELTLFRFSALTELVAVVYEPSLCLIGHGNKQVHLAGEVYRYDLVRFLLASVNLPIESRIIEASPSTPYLALRVGLDPAMVGELVAWVRVATRPKRRGAWR